MAIDYLISEYPQLTIITAELPKGLSGLYCDNVILLNKRLGNIEKHCILAEELGHYETSYGNITNLNDIKNQKLELVARRWGYEKLVSLDKLIECHKRKYWTIEEICFHLDITPEYLKNVLDYYNQKYGVYKIFKGYKISFDLLNIEKV